MNQDIENRDEKPEVKEEVLKIRRIVAYCVTRLCGHKTIVIRKSDFERMRQMTETACDACSPEIVDDWR